MKLESEVQQLIRLEAPKYGVTLWRNNSGALKDNTGRMVRFGLGNDSPNSPLASSDLIGMTAMGTFVAIECKKENWKWSGNEREQKQLDFLTFVTTRGGLAGFAKSVEDFKRIIGVK